MSWPVDAYLIAIIEDTVVIQQILVDVILLTDKDSSNNSSDKDLKKKWNRKDNIEIH